MLLTIVVIWAVVIPVAVLAISWLAPDRPQVRRAQTAGPDSAGKPAAAAPRRPRRALRLSSTAARRVCPELIADALRRRTSA